MWPSQTVLCLLVSMIVFASGSYTPTMFVSCQLGSDTSNECRNATSPCLTLTQALASSHGDDVVLFTGTCNNVALNVKISIIFLGCGWKNSTMVGAPGPQLNFPPCLQISNQVSVSVVNATVIGSTWLQGGAIYLSQGSLSIDSCYLSGGYSGSGGFLFIDNNATARIVNSVFYGNSAQHTGGAIFVGEEGRLTVAHSKFVLNTAFAFGTLTNGGGAIYVATNGLADISNSTFQHNSAYSFGGALFINQSSVAVVEGSQFAYNNAQLSGGAIYSSGILIMMVAMLANNSATELSGSGGALYFAAPSFFELINTTFCMNSASQGGGIWVGDGATGNLTETILDANQGENGVDVFTCGELFLFWTAVHPMGTLGTSISVADGWLYVANFTVAYAQMSVIYAISGTSIEIASATMINGTTPVIDTAPGSSLASITISDSNFINNIGPLSVIVPGFANLRVENSRFVGNAITFSIAEGGGVVLTTTPTTDGTTTIISGCHFESNIMQECDPAAGPLPGVILAQSSLTVTHSTFSRNVGCGTGGTIVAEDNVHISDCSFDSNSVSHKSSGGSTYGGAVMLVGGHSNSFTNCTFANNLADYGGAIAVVGSSSASYEPFGSTALSARNLNVSFNVAYTNGGGLFVSLQGKAVEIYESYWVGNIAPEGSVVSALDSTIAITGPFISCNNSGAVVLNSRSDITVNDIPFEAECPTDSCSSICSGEGICNITTGQCLYLHGCSSEPPAGAKSTCYDIAPDNNCSLTCLPEYCTTVPATVGQCNGVLGDFQPLLNITCESPSSLCQIQTVANALPTCATLPSLTVNCTYACAPEAQLMTPSNATSCGCSGTWSTLPVCTYPTCNPLDLSVTNANVTCFAINGTTQRCHVACDQGYAMIGMPDVTCHALTFNQPWVGPSCNIIQCAPGGPANLNDAATITCAGSNYSSSCTASCPAPFVPSAPVSVCTETQNWSPSIIQCGCPIGYTAQGSTCVRSLTCSWYATDVNGRCDVSTITYVGAALIAALLLGIILFICVRRRRARLARENEEGRPLLSVTDAPSTSARTLNMTYLGDGTISLRTAVSTRADSVSSGTLELKIDVGTIPMFSMRDLTVVGKLGEGGFAKVYHVRSNADYTDMALKSFGAVQSSDQVEGFVREVSTMVNLRHPNCLTCLGVTVDNNELGLLSEFMRGGDLESYIRKDPSIKEKYELFFKICQGIAYLHKQGITHADIKPGNVLLDGHGGVRIADFGLVGFKGVAYTPVYAAPEVVSGDRPTPRSDMYSMGVLVLRCFFTRWRTPTDENSAKAMLPHAATGLPEPLRKLTGGCLETEAGARPTSAALLDLFQSCLPKEAK